MSREAFYAVKVGRNPGIYMTWDKCLKEVDKFPAATYKKFNTLAEAQEFLLGSRDCSSAPQNQMAAFLAQKAEEKQGVPSQTFSGPFYAVRRGRKPGIYNSWAECLAQVEGFNKPTYRKFYSLQDAKEFLNGFGNSPVMLTTLPATVLNSSRSLPAIAGSYKRPNTVSTDLISPAKRLKTTQLTTPENTSTVVYTDGACVLNGRKGSKGGIGVYWGPGHELNVSLPLEGRQTNNRAEIIAAVMAIRQAKSIGLTDITLFTDSKFLINGVTDWIYKWKRNGWKLSNGKDVINKEDFEELDEARHGINVQFRHVRGHCGITGNVEADKLARMGVRP